MGQYQRAIQDHDEALNLDPKLALAYYNRGLAYGRLGRYQRAIQDFDEAIRLDPLLAVAYANRALAYTELGRDAQAQQDISRAVELGFDPTLLKEAIEDIKEQR